MSKQGRRLPKSAIGWASVWNEDEPSGPALCEVCWYKENLQPNLRHIRVRITPIKPKRRKP